MRSILASALALFTMALTSASWAGMPQSVAGGMSAASPSTAFIATAGGTVTLGGTPASNVQIQIADGIGNDTVCNMSNITYNKATGFVKLTPSSCFYSSASQNPPLELNIAGDFMTFHAVYNSSENNYVLTANSISVLTHNEGTVNAVSGTVQVY